MHGRHLIAAAALCMGATLGLVPSAQAESSSVRSTDGVLYEGCHYRPFSYAIDSDMAQHEWSLEVTAYDPRGAKVASSWLWKSDGAPSSGVAKGRDKGLEVCDSDGTGRYRLTAVLHLYTGPCTDEAVPEASFGMRHPGSRTRLKVDQTAHARGHRVRFVVQSRVQDRSGFVANGNRQVALERKTERGWVRFAVVDTDQDGFAVRSVAWRHRVVRKIRAVTLRTESSRPSRSRVVRIG